MVETEEIPFAKEEVKDSSLPEVTVIGTGKTEPRDVPQPKPERSPEPKWCRCVGTR